MRNDILNALALPVEVEFRALFISNQSILHVFVMNYLTYLFIYKYWFPEYFSKVNSGLIWSVSIPVSIALVKALKSYVFIFCKKEWNLIICSIPCSKKSLIESLIDISSSSSIVIGFIVKAGTDIFWAHMIINHVVWHFINVFCQLHERTKEFSVHFLGLIWTHFTKVFSGLSIYLTYLEK